SITERGTTPCKTFAGSGTRQSTRQSVVPLVAGGEFPLLYKGCSVYSRQLECASAKSHSAKDRPSQNLQKCERSEEKATVLTWCSAIRVYPSPEREEDP